MLIFVSWKIHLICRLGGGKKKYNRVVYWISIINSFVVYTLTAAKKNPLQKWIEIENEWTDNIKSISSISFFAVVWAHTTAKIRIFKSNETNERELEKKNVVLGVGQSKQNSDSSYQKQSYRKWTEKVVKVM